MSEKLKAALIMLAAVEGVPSKVCRFLAAHSSFKARLKTKQVKALDLACLAPEGRPCLKKTKAGEKPEGCM